MLVYAGTVMLYAVCMLLPYFPKQLGSLINTDTVFTGKRLLFFLLSLFGHRNSISSDGGVNADSQKWQRASGMRHNVCPVF